MLELKKKNGFSFCAVFVSFVRFALDDVTGGTRWFELRDAYFRECLKIAGKTMNSSNGCDVGLTIWNSR